MKQQKELETGVIKQSEAKETVSGSGQKGKIWRSYSGMRKLATVAAVFGMVLILGAGVVHAAERFFGINYFWSLYGTTRN